VGIAEGDIVRNVVGTSVGEILGISLGLGAKLGVSLGLGDDIVGIEEFVDGTKLG
jgi:hypothetical protein